MRETIVENEDWTVQKDEEKKVMIVSYFEDGHFRDEIIIPYDKLNLENK